MIMIWSVAKEAFGQELQKAEEARQAGYEGRARVCARRAAGIVIRAYLSGQEMRVAGQSAYELLVQLQELPDMPVRVGEAAQRLAMRVNENFVLPAETDLIEEARQLAHGLEAKLLENE